MLTITNLTYYVGGRALYTKTSLTVKSKEKIGLVGLNGTGKSTLLQLINGTIVPNEGVIHKGKNYTIGFLHQDLMAYQTQDSIRSVAMQAFEEALQVQKQLDSTLQKMEIAYTDALMEKLTALQTTFEHLGGYQLQSKTEEILEGMGFSTKDLDRPLQSFSGGERMRVMLAKLLLVQPDLLMLDEPTNHLDLPAIQWVENYLQHYPNSIIVVSHDRQFLDNITNKTVEISAQQLHQYMGNYSFFLEEKALREDIQQKSYKNQQKKIKETTAFIERFRAKSSKAKQVQSRIKSLEKMDKISTSPNTTAAMKIAFSINKQPSKIVAKMDNVSKSFGAVTILKNTYATIERGDKIALIGANGKGKSTLLKILQKSIPIDQGNVQLGNYVSSTLYAQHQLDALNINNTLLEEVQQISTAKTEEDLRRVLGMFLFKKQDVFKQIKVLSGGEKARVALAKILLSEANFLLLDEPTNHLDMISIDMIAQALLQYAGTYIVISHNRNFIKQVANKIWYIEDQQIKVYPGTYTEYEYAKNAST